MATFFENALCNMKYSFVFFCTYKIFEVEEIALCIYQWNELNVLFISNCFLLIFYLSYFYGYIETLILAN